MAAVCDALCFVRPDPLPASRALPSALMQSAFSSLFIKVVIICGTINLIAETILLNGTSCSLQLTERDSRCGLAGNSSDMCCHTILGDLVVTVSAGEGGREGGVSSLYTGRRAR
jgi:hypothetical protein